MAQCHPLPPVASMLLSPTVAPGPLIDLAGDVIAWATKGVEEAKEVEGAEEDKESLRVSAGEREEKEEEEEEEEEEEVGGGG